MEGERRRVEMRQGEEGGCGEKLVCGWNGEMIVRWIWGEARGGACQGREGRRRMDGWRDEWMEARGC